MNLPKDMNCTIDFDQANYGIACRAPLATLGKGKLSLSHVPDLASGPVEDALCFGFSSGGNCAGLHWT